MAFWALGFLLMWAAAGVVAASATPSVATMSANLTCMAISSRERPLNASRRRAAAHCTLGSLDRRFQLSVTWPTGALFPPLPLRDLDRCAT